MNTPLKVILTLSAIFCALALGTLGWLAIQTTEVKDVNSAKTPSFPPKLVVKETKSQQDVIAAMEPAESVQDDLTQKLTDLAAAEGVVKGELVLTFDSPEALNAFRVRAGLEGIEILYSDARLKVARVRYKDAAKMAQELREHSGDYDNIGANYFAYVPGTPKSSKDGSNAGGSLPFESSALDAIGAVGDRSRWGAGVKVAVLDTGVTAHPALNGVKITHTDLIKDGLPFHGHGNAMTSLIAGRDAENGGVSPATEILDIRVADSTGRGNTAYVSQGIMHAVDAGARVISISLGSNADSSMLRNAVDYARRRGVIVVAAAGNEQETRLSYPAAYSGVISVAAMAADGQQASFSNSGEGLFISAPGVGIVSAYSGTGMVIGSGTSQATALTSGVIASLLSRNYNAANIPQILQKNAVRSTAPANQVGAGMVHFP
ncbi:MAG: S8 family serine peptidase [Verrucomicrobia bacterium]|nr:S8 family serine peptidase [Verrucomicrobiota bacterium]